VRQPSRPLLDTTLCAAAGQVKVVLVVAVALIDGSNRVLLAQRPPGKSMEGLWEFPGGKVRLGPRPR
jgi:8-oxo-dGTP diphosphatase